MSKRLWFSSAPVLVVLAAACWVPACGDSSSDSDGTAGGGGGFVMEGGADQSVDSPSESSQPETGQPDVSEEPSNEAGVDVEILEGSLFDLSMPDVVLNDSGATLQGCYDCTEVACPGQLSECEKNDNCRTLILCFFQDGCFDPSQQYGVDFGCAMTCAGKAGITGMQDPAAALGMDVASCMQTSCAEPCGITDAGTPPPDTGTDVVTDVVSTDVQTEAAVDAATVDALAE